MNLDRSAIAACVPHAGAMVLLDSVIDWDGTRICCSAPPPQRDHPLARDGVVPALAAAEYGAQAAAVHGYLLEQPTTPRAGVLAKLSDVTLHANTISASDGALRVQAQLVSKVQAGCVYAFDVSSGARPLASGRILLAFGERQP